MRRTVECWMCGAGAVFAALLCCVAASNAMAEEPHEKWLKYLEGGWKAEFAAGDTAWVKNEFVADGRALFNVNPTRGGVSLMGWRPDTKTLVQTIYSAKGGFHQAEFSEVTERSMRVTTRGALDNGTVYKGTGELRKTGDDSYEISDEVASAYWKFTGTNKFTRQEKQSPATEADTAAETDTDATEQKPYQKWLDYLEGDWKRESPPGKGNMRLVANGHALVFAEDEGGFTLVGWQQDTKALVFTGYLPSGGFLQVEYTDVGDNTLAGTVVGTLVPSLPVFSGKGRIEKIDEDRYKLTGDLKLGEGNLAISQEFHRQQKGN